jgi:hypothetical protein
MLLAVQLTRAWPTALLLAATGGLALVAPWFAHGVERSPASYWVATGLMTLAGAAYLVAVIRKASVCCLAAVVAVGAALRLLLLFSTPVLEMDFYRYLWDGGVLASGRNPYAWSPKDARDGVLESGQPAPEWLTGLAERSGPVIQRVHYPRLRTIYPPVAQGAFALAHVLRPWSLASWRLVALAADVATLVLLLALLRELGLPAAASAVYWWNPLVVKELVNSAHMDGLALPLVVGALLLSVRKRHVPAAVLLAVAVGAKLWPVLLLPFVLRPAVGKPKQLVLAFASWLAVVWFFVLIVLSGSLDARSGFVAYGREWEMNDAAYVAVHEAVMWVTGLERTAAHAPARAVVGLVLVAWVAWLAWPPLADGRDLVRRCLLAVAALFLLSPTQFPWYYVWMVPLLAVCPWRSLLAWTALLPLYYLRFYFKAFSDVAIFDYGVVLAEHVPVACLAVWEWRRARRT